MCSENLVGLNTALMKVAGIVFGDRYNLGGADDLESLDITLKPSEEDEEESIDFKESNLESLKAVTDLENI